MSNLQHFATIDIEYFHTPDSIIISLLTNNPCHLTCYYTDKKPLKHHTTRIVRGLEVPWGVYFCFVAWKAIEQNEAGDTIWHTFVIPDWSYCQTKWFTFRGTIVEVLSPSVGPIFMHHHSGYLPPTITLRPNAPGDVCLLPGEAGLPCPNHWQNVNEVIEDDFITTVISHPTDWSWDYYDLYHIQPLELIIPHSITNLRVYARCIIKDHYIHHEYWAARIGLKTLGTEDWTTSKIVRTGWSNLYQDWAINPITGASWTLAQINDLQIGICLRTPYIIPDPEGLVYCTQVWAVISLD